MRTLLAATAVVAVAATAVGQSAPYTAEVTADAAPLRAGPGDQMPDTGRLYRGTRLEVDHEEAGGWLAVQPPRGQVSWVRAVHLEPAPGQPADALPRNMRVHAEPDAELAYGKPGERKPLDVRKTRVPDGTVLMVIGHKVEHGGVGWVPIEPPYDDFRYVRKDAVRLVTGKPVQSFAVRSPEPPADPGPASVPNPNGPVTPAAGTQTGRPADWPNHPLWQQAEQAERAGDTPRAEKLYLQLAAEMNRPGGDADLANLCYTRVHGLRERQRTGGRPAGGALTASGGSTRPPEPAAGSGGDEPPQWVGPGGLRLAGFRVDGRSTTYALVGDGGKVVCYAVPGPGVDLDRFRGYEVWLYGSVSRPADLRGVGMVTVSHVRQR